MDLEPRTTAPAHATGAVEFVPLEAVSTDATFRLRDEGDVSDLAASIGRLGQLAPVELRPVPGAPPGEERFQIVAGFRRIAALRLLARDRVLARIHRPLEDDDAWSIALTDALLHEPLVRGEVEELRDRLAQLRSAAWAEDLLDDAVARAPVDAVLRERFLEFLDERAGARSAFTGTGEGGAEETVAEERVEAETVEVTPEELVRDLSARMFEVTQDLALALGAWADLPAEGRRTLLEQVRWVAALLPSLEGKEE